MNRAATRHRGQCRRRWSTRYARPAPGGHEALRCSWDSGRREPTHGLFGIPWLCRRPLESTVTSTVVLQLRQLGGLRAPRPAPPGPGSCYSASGEPVLGGVHEPLRHRPRTAPLPATACRYWVSACSATDPLLLGGPVRHRLRGIPGRFRRPAARRRGRPRARQLLPQRPPAAAGPRGPPRN